MEDERRRDAGGVRRLARRLLRGVEIVVGSVLVLMLLFIGGRIVLYRQADDRDHVAAKRAYLERIADVGAADGQGPNLVLILFDDLGYGDIGAYGGTTIRTPNLDRLASEGLMFRHGYSAAPYCSASRAGLMTGRYPVRSGMDHVLQAPWDYRDVLLRLGWKNRRLPAEEITLADVLEAAGYDTAIVGKWHLGSEAPSRPIDMGFGSYYGLLYSNDQGKPVVWEDDRVVEPHPIDQTTLTWRYTERAVQFIEQPRDDRPFFLYLPHTFPHVPLHAAGDRIGGSPAGLYGDVVEELDDSVGEVIEALQRSQGERETLVVISSDNGPWFQGSQGDVRGRKFDVFEGGMRVPFLVWWLGRSQEGRVLDEPVISIDLFPTVLELAGLPLPDDRVIDGQSLVPLLTGEETLQRDEPIWFHQIGSLRGLREGRFKYHDRHRVLFGNPMDWPWAPFRDRGPWLFDLLQDPDESYDASRRYPEEAHRLRALFEERRSALERNPSGWL